MKIFRVGGAVRDKLLHYPSTENDWVVVGSSPEELIEQGFQPVGQDFPVFLHPKTKEEYALARTERKSGHGYGGFHFYCGQDVTLEDDLRRRDLTINAIAEDSQGNLIDPYGGQQDLTNKILRHVDPAFVEDPLRVLRVARFAARYAHLGFSVAEETLKLMQDIVTNGEVDHLVRERIWKETERALHEKNPDVYLQVLRACGALARLMPEVDALYGVPQTAIHHPEVDTGIHIELVLQQAAQRQASTAVLFAALSHDLGKGTTPPQDWPRHIGHETRGLPLVKKLAERLCAPKECREFALLVCEFHTHSHRALELRPETLLKVFKSLDCFRRKERLAEFALASECDARGRTGFENRDYPQHQYLLAAFESCNAISSQAIAQAGFIGKAFGEEVDRQRIQALSNFKQQYALTNA